MINTVILMGRLCADPELKTTQSGISVSVIRIAVDRSYVKSGSERQTDFFDVVAWRSTAEFLCRNFSKGSLIAVVGQLQSRQYQTKDGQNRTVVEVVADQISFTGERRDTAETPSNASVSRETAQAGNYYTAPQNAPQTRYQTADEPLQRYNATESAPPRYSGGTRYDPRSRQGEFDRFPRGGVTPDEDLPWGEP